MVRILLIMMLLGVIAFGQRKNYGSFRTVSGSLIADDTVYTNKMKINPTNQITADSVLTIDNGEVKRSALVDLSAVTANIIKTDTLVMSGDTIINVAVLLVDDGYWDLPTGRTISGSVFVKGSAERCDFYVVTDGTVTRDFYNDFVATDTDTKACIYDAGAYAKIKNRLGSSKTFIISYAY